MAQLVASVSGVVLGGVAVVVGSNLARGKIFTASIGSVDSLYPSVYIYIYGSWVRISLDAKYLQHLSAQLIHYIPPYIYIYRSIKKVISLRNISKVFHIF